MLPLIAWALLIAALILVVLGHRRTQQGQNRVSARCFISQVHRPHSNIIQGNGSNDGAGKSATVQSCPMSSVEPLEAGAFQWATQEPLKIRPFKPIYHITMGTFHQLSLGNQ